MFRRVGAATAAVFVLLMLVPAPGARAALAAPVILGPAGTSAADVDVTFRWLRVPGAVRYHLRIWHESAQGQLHTDVLTVNDTHVTTVNFAGDVAFWSVASVGSDNLDGPAATATFTTARLTATLLAPANGTTIVHPDASALLRYRPVPDQFERTFADRNASGAIEDMATEVFPPGLWRWNVHNQQPPNAPYSPSAASEIRTFSVTWPAGVPALSSPAPSAAFQFGSAPRLEWQEAAGAGVYQFEVRRVSDDFAVAGSIGKATWADLQPHLSPGDYTWRVRSMLAGTMTPGSEVFGAWSPSRTFTVQLPAAPTLTFPADGAELSSWPILRWDAVPGHPGYAVQIALSEDPDANLSGLSGTAVPAWTFAPSGTGGPYDGPSTGGTRYWRVKAVAPNSDPLGGWSEWRSFSVAPVIGNLQEPMEATRLGPADCISATCDLTGLPLLRWSEVPKAAYYRVFFRWDGGAGEANSWVDVAGTSTTLRRYFQTSPGDRTSWAVVACSTTTCTETMPASRERFRITPPTPSQLGLDDGASMPSAVMPLRWEPAIAGDGVNSLDPGVSYDVQWRRTPGDGTASDLYVESTHGHGWTTTPVREGVEVTWRIRSRMDLSSGSAAGAWSPWRTYTRSATPPVLISPAEGASVGADPVLDWSTPPFSYAGFRVEVSRTEALEWYGAQHWDYAANVIGTSAPFTDLPGGIYRWRVRRDDSTAYYAYNAGQSAWTSGTFVVTGPTRPVALSPSGGVSVRADDVVLTWDPIAGASEYSIVVGTTPSPTWDTAVYHAFARRTTHAVTDLLPTGTLYWRVCSSMQCSEAAAFGGGTSTVQSFAITPAPGPDVNAPVTATGSATTRSGVLGTNGGIPATLRWTTSDAGGSGIARQDLQLRRGTASWQTITVPPSVRTAAVVLVPGATYTMRVRAIDGAGNAGAWASRTITPSLRQETSSAWTWSSGWTRVTSSSASGGGRRYATRAGATGSMTFTGRSIALVAPRSSTRGAAAIYLDGVRVAALSLNAAPTGARQVVFTKSWPALGTHRIVVKVLGTAGRPRVDVDAFAILK